MPNYHSTVAVGHLGRDPESRFTASNMQVCNFSVAVTEKRKGEENTTWYRVIAFDKLAALCAEYLRKGDPVMIVGRMQSRKFTTKDGGEKESWELVADTVQFLGAKSKAKPDVQVKDFSDMSDDIPFN